jgi:hypothetical protein
VRRETEILNLRPENAKLAISMLDSPYRVRCSLGAWSKPDLGTEA